MSSSIKVSYISHVFFCVSCLSEWHLLNTYTGWIPCLSHCTSSIRVDPYPSSPFSQLLTTPSLLSIVTNNSNLSDYRCSTAAVVFRCFHAFRSFVMHWSWQRHRVGWNFVKLSLCCVKIVADICQGNVPAVGRTFCLRGFIDPSKKESSKDARHPKSHLFSKAEILSLKQYEHNDISCIMTPCPPFASPFIDDALIASSLASKSIKGLTHFSPEVWRLNIYWPCAGNLSLRKTEEYSQSPLGWGQLNSEKLLGKKYLFCCTNFS